MRRPVRVLVVLLLAVAALALVARPFIWSPLPRFESGAVPALAAPLRTPAEHDRISAAQADWPIACAIDGPAGAGGSGSGSGAALVLGFRHTSDPADPQIAALGARFAAFRPTLCLVEGRLGWWIGGTTALLERFGESGMAAALADDAGIRCESLEPDFAAEVRDAVAEFGDAKTLAFYFLRVFVSDRDAGQLGDNRAADAAALLRKRGRLTGLGAALPDLAAFDRFWAASDPPHPDWRELPREALWRDTDGAWTRRLAERINAFRDRHMVAAIARGVAEGERVLAVCGASHLILFEPALRAALARPR